jgi:hypothetical protein
MNISKISHFRILNEFATKDTDQFFIGLKYICFGHKKIDGLSYEVFIS